MTVTLRVMTCSDAINLDLPTLIASGHGNTLLGALKLRCWCASSQFEGLVCSYRRPVSGSSGENEQGSPEQQERTPANQCAVTSGRTGGASCLGPNIEANT
jgi:hypothetical protein